MNQITENHSYSVLGCDTFQSKGMEGTTTIATAATVALALLVVAKTRTVGLTEATGNPVQNTMSIYDLDVGHPFMKNLPAQEIPLP